MKCEFDTCSNEACTQIIMPIVSPNNNQVTEQVINLCQQCKSKLDIINNIELEFEPSDEPFDWHQFMDPQLE